MSADLYGLLAPEREGRAELDVGLETLHLSLRDPFRIARDEPERDVTTLIVETVSSADKMVSTEVGRAIASAWRLRRPGRQG